MDISGKDIMIEDGGAAVMISLTLVLLLSYQRSFNFQSTEGSVKMGRLSLYSQEFNGIIIMPLYI